VGQHKSGAGVLPKGQESLQVTNSFVFENVDIEEAPNGTVWMAASNGSVRAITSQDGKYRANGPSIDVNSDGIYVARDGALWISTIVKVFCECRIPIAWLAITVHQIPLWRASLNATD